LRLAVQRLALSTRPIIEVNEIFKRPSKEARADMRWKLLLIASLLATLLGAGLTLLIIFALNGPGKSLGFGGIYLLSTLLCPIAAITYASIFVYRHTARRRSLQAILAALISIFLTLTVLLASSMLYEKSGPRFLLPAPSQRNVG
jgi:uncharacterized BrkB/YihY/UPF0761 family membrane protein